MLYQFNHKELQKSQQILFEQENNDINDSDVVDTDYEEEDTNTTEQDTEEDTQIVWPLTLFHSVCFL